MDWNRIIRRKYNRDHLRYTSDLTAQEYQLIAPFLPPPCGGRPRKWPWKVLLEGMLYILENGIACGRCRRIFRHGRPYAAPSVCCAREACWNRYAKDW